MIKESTNTPQRGRIPGGGGSTMGFRQYGNPSFLALHSWPFSQSPSDRHLLTHNCSTQNVRSWHCLSLLHFCPSGNFGTHLWYLSQNSPHGQSYAISQDAGFNEWPGDTQCRLTRWQMVPVGHLALLPAHGRPLMLRAHFPALQYPLAQCVCAAQGPLISTAIVKLSTSLCFLPLPVRTDFTV